MPRITPIKRKRFEKFLEYVGCELKRTKGDHFIYSRKGLERPVVITNEKNVPVFIIRNNLRVLGIDHDQYLEIMKSI